MVRVAAIGAWIWLAAWSAHAVEPPTSDAARTAYASAAALQNREAWDLAAEEWASLLKAHPTDPLALKGRYYLAVCQLKAADWPAAEKTLRDVIASKADADTQALARLEFGRGLFRTAQAKPAPAAFAAAATTLADFLATSPAHPQAAEAASLAAESLWQAGRRDEAIAAWQAFIRDRGTAPQVPDVLYALGVGLAEQGKRPEAAAVLERFAKEHPGHRLAEDVALWRADVALALDRPADAETIAGPIAAGGGPRAGAPTRPSGSSSRGSGPSPAWPSPTRRPTCTAPSTSSASTSSARAGSSASSASSRTTSGHPGGSGRTSPRRSRAPTGSATSSLPGTCSRTPTSPRSGCG
jgi:TolA-binding protein